MSEQTQAAEYAGPVTLWRLPGPPARQAGAGIGPVTNPRPWERVGDFESVAAGEAAMARADLTGGGQVALWPKGVTPPPFDRDRRPLAHPLAARRVM